MKECLKSTNVQELSEKFLVVRNVGFMSVVDGAEYFDDIQQCKDYINTLPKVSSTEYTICRIYRGA